MQWRCDSYVKLGNHFPFAKLILALLVVLASWFSAKGATVTWFGGSGDWNTTNNWSTHALPATGDNVVIGVGPSITVTHTSGTHSVNSIQNYTPSLSVLGRCAERDRKVSGDRLVVGNPTGDLRFTDVEVAALRKRYPERVELWRSAATKEAMFAAAGSSRLLHYTGHSTFNPVDQLDSGLLLAGDQGGEADLLTLREVFAGLNLRRNFLTVLNGCESGMVRPDMADEYVTLPSGLLYAGAVCVVSTLWSVHDLSAALLMDRFHAEWRGGETVSAALREAARWLRQDIRDGASLMTEILPEFLKNVDDATLRAKCEESARAYAARHPNTPPFASPVHWAPFIATGVAYGDQQASGSTVDQCRQEKAQRIEVPRKVTE
jgi:CHAT domain-containing protein